MKRRFTAPLFARLAATISVALGALPVHAQVYSTIVWDGRFVQTNDTQVNLDYYQVQGGISKSQMTDATFAQVTFAGSPSPITFNNLAMTNNFYGGRYTTESAMTAEFPINTAYTFSYSGGTLGNQSATVNAPTVNPMPDAIPQLTAGSFNSLQGMNTAQDLTVNCNLFTAASGFNGIRSLGFLDIQANSYTPEVTFSSETTATIAAGMLQSDRDYAFFLTFENLQQHITTQPFTTVGYFYQTQGTFRTGSFITAAPEPSSLPLITTTMGILFALVAQHACRLRRIQFEIK